MIQAEVIALMSLSFKCTQDLVGILPFYPLAGATLSLSSPYKYQQLASFEV